MKKILSIIASNLYWLLFIVISLVSSIIILVLNQKDVIKPGLAIIQHLLTVASIVLGIIAIDLTILISIRNGAVYKRIKEKKGKILEQLYGYAIASIVSSAIVIGLSLLIISSKKLISEHLLYKQICIILLATSFINMILDTSMSFLQNVQLLKLDDKNNSYS